MTSGQKKFPVAPTISTFNPDGRAGRCSANCPHLGGVADDLCIVRCSTPGHQHDPADHFHADRFATRGPAEHWLMVGYGLGSENKDLPAYVVLTSVRTGGDEPAALMIGSGVRASCRRNIRLKFRNKGDPVLYLSNPPGVDRDSVARTLDNSAAQRAAPRCLGDRKSRPAFRIRNGLRMAGQRPRPDRHLEESPEVLGNVRPDQDAGHLAPTSPERRLGRTGRAVRATLPHGWDHHGGLPTAIKGHARYRPTYRPH